MDTYIVTIRLPKRPDHDPGSKKTARCPQSDVCTDSTGEHHSFLAGGPSAPEVAEYYRCQGYRVTRVELASLERVNELRS